MYTCVSSWTDIHEFYATGPSKHFLTGWNCKKVHMSKRITCFYGKCANSRVYKSTYVADKRRKPNTLMKEQYGGCPFEIRFSFIKVNPSIKNTQCFL